MTIQWKALEEHFLMVPFASIISGGKMRRWHPTKKFVSKKTH
jgi:hypothetical protein